MEGSVEPERDWLGQPDACHRAARDIQGVEYSEETLEAGGFEGLADHGSRRAFSVQGSGDEDRLAPEIVTFRGLVELDAAVGPIGVDELVEELPSGTASPGDSQHPEVAIGPAGPSGVD